MVEELDELKSVRLRQGDISALYRFLKMNPRADHYPQAVTSLDAGTVSRVCCALSEAIDSYEG